MSIAEFPVPVGSERSSERVPPQDIAAEMSVLGAMMLSKDAIADVVETLREGDFYRPSHQTIYAAIIDLYGRGEPADAITVANELTRAAELARVGGAAYLHTLVSSVPTAANAGYYARIVNEQAILRRLVEAGTRIVQIAQTGDGDVDDIVDRAQAEVYDVTERRTSDDYQPLSTIMGDALAEIEAIGNRGGAMVGVPTGFADLDALTNGLHPGQLVVIAARPAIGKALALDTPLPTPDGWTTMADVGVGDLLLDAEGRPTRVVAATDVLRDRPCYRVEFNDGTSIVADADHTWCTRTRAERRHRDVRLAGLRTTREIAETLVCGTAERRRNHSVPTTAPIHGIVRDLPLPPYSLGVLLGDGTTAAEFATGDPEIAMHVEAEGLRATPTGACMRYRMAYATTPERRVCVVCGSDFEPATWTVRTCGRQCGGRAGFVSAPVPRATCPDCGRSSSGLRRCSTCHRDHGTVQATLHSMGVLGSKHIPAVYLRSHESQRRALLAGLLDIDGTVNPTGSVQFSTTSAALARDVEELVVSLGYRAHRSVRKVRGRDERSSTCVTITFTTDDDVFRLERKRLAHKERRRGKPTRRPERFITAVVPVPTVPVRCVEVDNPAHLYLAGRSMVPTHNSTLGLDLARAASIRNGLPSCIFSLEMGRNEIVMRLLSAEAQIALHHMRSGSMSDNDWTKLARKMSAVSEAPLFIDDSPNLTMMEIRAKARRLKQRHDLRLVVVDYLQLMTSGKKVESRQQEVSEFSRQMKLLAKELEVPVVAISQLNRGPEQRQDKKPMLSDLRESGSIEQDADVVVLIHREDAYERESPRAGEADFIVAKHRNGPTATVTVAFQGHYSRFVDMASM